MLTPALNFLVTWFTWPFHENVSSMFTTGYLVTLTPTIFLQYACTRLRAYVYIWVVLLLLHTIMNSVLEWFKVSWLLPSKLILFPNYA